ncbi:MAG: phytanoyl-CoA dioxygenase family protein, partial [Chloroflexota bacterium]
MYSRTVTLNEEQIATFHQDGYLVLPEITTPSEIERLRKIYDHLFTIKAGREEGNQYDLASTDEDTAAAVLPQILNPAKYAPELQNILYRANAAALA